MRRRDFLEGGTLASFYTLLAHPPTVEAKTTGKTNLSSFHYNFTTPYKKVSVLNAYASSNAGEESPVPLPPQVLLHYNGTKFQKPSELESLLPATTPKYQLDADLYSFGTSSRNANIFKKLNADLQLSFNVGAGSGDDLLSWLFMSAIDVFFEKNEAGRKQKLAKFKDYKPTSNLKPQSKIIIPEGKLNLQVSALGQRRDSIWAKIFGIAKAIAGSPLLGTLAIPNLVFESLEFVSKVFTTVTTQDKVVKVWETNPLRFALNKAALKDADFPFVEGFWVSVDREFALDTKYLQNHSLDKDTQGFQILGPDSRTPIDANYLVTKLTLKEMK
jgi:hypothetical protein